MRQDQSIDTAARILVPWSLIFPLNCIHFHIENVAYRQSQGIKATDSDKSVSTGLR